MKRARPSRPRCWISTSKRKRVSLGIKQLESDPIEKAGPSGGALRKGSVVTGTVTEVNDGGIEVELDGGVKSFIRRADLARDRNDQRPERFGKGDKVDALVTSVDKASRKVSLSIKAREISEEKDAVAQFGSSDSGASLGDILGAAPEEEDAQEEGWGRRVIFVPSEQIRRGASRAFFCLDLERWVSMGWRLTSSLAEAFKARVEEIFTLER